MAASSVDLPRSLSSTISVNRSGANRYSPWRTPNPTTRRRRSLMLSPPGAPAGARAVGRASFDRLLVGRRHLAQSEGIETIVERALDQGPLFGVALAIQALEQGARESMFGGEPRIVAVGLEVIVGAELVRIDAKVEQARLELGTRGQVAHPTNRPALQAHRRQVALIDPGLIQSISHSLVDLLDAGHTRDLDLEIVHPSRIEGHGFDGHGRRTRSIADVHLQRAVLAELGGLERHCRAGVGES